jgi:hypothetical protein
LGTKLELHAQGTNLSADKDLKTLLLQTDTLLGADDELINGKIYIQKYMLAEGHPFFFTPQWQNGSVKVNGTEYNKLLMKYNIYTDELLLRAETVNGGTSVISLNNEFIESFHLGGKHFINAMHFEVKGIQTDFVEFLYKGSFVFFVSYTKLYNNDYNIKTPYGSYGKTKTSYFLMQKNELREISSKKALLKYFENQKKQIKKYMKKHKIKYAKASDVQLHELMEYIDQLSPAIR